MSSNPDASQPAAPPRHCARPHPTEPKSPTQTDAVRVNWAVLAIAATGILAIAGWALAAPEHAGGVLTSVVVWISKWFGSFYIVLATAILGFVLYLGFSRFGHIRLGPPNARPEFSTFAWAAMLFAAGIGTDIMFFAVAEPVSQYWNPPTGDPQSIESARQSVVWTLFHYGITGWGMYALMGIALGYFAYRHHRPLAVRSALYPVFGERINGVIGHLVDSAAVLGTIFGVATTLGIGVIQLNVGLDILFGIKPSLAAQISLVVLAVAIATASAISGIDRGIRILSQLNVLLAIGLSAWVLVTGRTDFLLNAIVGNVGDFVSRFPSMTLDTFAWNDASEWMMGWTLFFWAWWVAWASFIGMFLARISRGRTLREFVAGTMVIPFLYVLMWISIFGNSAVERIRQGDLDFATMTIDTPELGFYTLLQDYPLATMLIAVATFVGLLFYVTSADSGALVMANLSSHLPTVRDDAPAWLRIFWAAVTGVLTIAVLVVGGITALQNATIVTGLPFSFVMLLVIGGVYSALRADERAERSRAQSARNVVTGGGSALGQGQEAWWSERLARMFDQVTPRQASAYLDRVIQPTLEAVAAQMRQCGVAASVVRGGDEDVEDVDVETVIHDRVTFTALEGEQRFVYRILAIDATPAAYGGSMFKPGDRSTRLEVHRPEGGQDYDVMGYSGDAIANDVLNHFDRHQEFWRIREDLESRNGNGGLHLRRDK